MGVDERCYTARGAAVPVLPAGGPVFWHRPESLPAGGEGAPVLLWRDTSDYKNDLRPLTLAAAPLKTLAFLGGLPAAVFLQDAPINRTLLFGVDGPYPPEPLQLRGTYSLYVVATLGGPAGYKTGPQLTGASGLFRPALGGSDTEVAAYTATGAVSGPAAFTPLESHIWHVRRKGAEVEVGVDGAAIASGTVPFAEQVALSALQADQGPGPAGRSTVVSELIGYPHLLDDLNHQLTVQYFKIRYGL